MRTFLIAVSAAALLASCSPPASQTETPPPAPGPTVTACNQVAPNANQQVRIEEELAVAAAAADLRGGPISPGTYDLTRAVRVGSATGWNETRAVALDVTEQTAGGVTFNWAGAAPDGEVDTWTASFTENGDAAQLSYSCGRIGTVDADYTASANALQLRLQDGANGALLLDFARRA